MRVREFPKLDTAEVINDDIESQMADTEERMHKLIEAQDKRFREWAAALQREVEELTDGMTPPITAKELAQPIQKLRFEMRHNRDQSLAAERKRIVQLQELETETESMKVGHFVHQIVVKKPRIITLNPKHSSTTQLKSLIREWAERVECQLPRNYWYPDNTVSSVSWGYPHLRKGYRCIRFQRQVIGVDEPNYKQCWNSMKANKDSVEHIRIDPMKVCQRHIDSYAQFQKLKGEKLEIVKYNLIRNKRKFQMAEVCSCFWISRRNEM